MTDLLNNRGQLVLDITLLGPLVLEGSGWADPYAVDQIKLMIKNGRALAIESITYERDAPHSSYAVKLRMIERIP